MSMGTERSKALHNFTSPVGLRWGNQKVFRYIKVDSDGQFIPNDADHHQQSINQRRTTCDRERDKDSSASRLLPFGSLQMGSAPPPVSDDGFAFMRENVKLDVQTAADKFKAATFKVCHKDGSVSVSAVIPGEGETKNPWNLRKRRAACKTPASGFIFGTNGGSSAVGVSGKTLRADGAKRATDELSRIRSGRNVAAICGEKLTRDKFSIALSKREIGEDFLAFTGHKQARRPKKRAKIVQRELDTLFPGLSLTEITADMYKVSEGAP